MSTRDPTADADTGEAHWPALLARYTGHGLLVADANGRLLWTNERFRQIRDCAIEIARGGSLSEVLAGPASDPTVVAQLCSAITHADAISDLELRLPSASGVPRWVCVDLQPARQGQALYFVATCADITARKARETEIEALSKRLSLALAAGKLGVWERDIASGRVIWSDEAYALFGVPRARAADSFDEFTERVHPDDRTALTALRAHLSSSEQPTEARLRVRVEKPNGATYRHFVATAQRVHHDGRDVVVGVMQDVHERTLTEGDARRTAARLAEAAGATGMGMWEWDILSNEMRWDEAMARLFRLPQERGPRTYEEFREIVVPEDRVTTDAAIGAALHGEAPFEAEFRLRWPDGSTRTTASRGVVERDAAGNAIRMLGVNWDVTDRRAAEAADRTARQRLALTAQFAGLGFWRWDAEADCFEFDERCRTLFGRSQAPRECTTSEWRHWLHPDDAAAAYAALRGALMRTVTAHDYRVVYPDGRVVRVSSRGEVQHNSVGAAVSVVGLCWNATESYEAQQAALQRLGVLVDATGLGIWEKSLRDGATTWDAGMYRIFGVDPSDSTPPRQLFDRALLVADRTIVQAQERDLVALGRAFNVEFRICRPDGTMRFILSHASAITGDASTPGDSARIIGVNIDITERVQANAAAHALTSRLQLATEAAGIGSWELAQDGKSLVWDAQMYRLYGAAFTAQPPATLAYAGIHPEDRSVVETAHARALTNGEPFDYEFRVRWPDGSVRWLAARGRVQYSEDGQARGLVGVNWDITDRKLADEAIRARETAERANQAKNRFLAHMSHELRTPLNAILGFAQLLERDSTDPPSAGQRERAAHIRTAGRHLLQLVDDVLDLTRLESGTAAVAMEPVAVEALVREAIGLATADIPTRNVACTFERSGDCADHVWADRARLRQVLLNLLAHAIDASTDGGRVEVHGATRSPTQLVLSVTDYGRAPAAADAERLFEPFNRVRSVAPHEATADSMGLAITQRLVQQMEGQIEFSSAQGRNTFLVALRIAHVDTTRTPSGTLIDGDGDTDTGALEPSTHVSGTVLYVEDNPGNSLLVEQFLHLRPKVKLFSAPDGATGLVLAAVCQPDVVLVDMKLPDMDGLEVLAALRRQRETRHLVCIAVSANTLLADIQRARDAGFAGYWTKPLSVHRFLHDLDHHLSQTRLTPSHAAQSRSQAA